MRLADWRASAEPDASRAGASSPSSAEAAREPACEAAALELARDEIDEEPAKAEVGALIARLGFFGVDLGGLAEGARLTQFPGGPLPVHNFVRFG